MVKLKNKKDSNKSQPQHPTFVQVVSQNTLILCLAVLTAWLSSLRRPPAVIMSRGETLEHAVFHDQYLIIRIVLVLGVIPYGLYKYR